MTAILRSFQELAEQLKVTTFDDAIRLFLGKNDSTHFKIIEEHLRSRIRRAASRVCNGSPDPALLDDCLQLVLLDIVENKDHVLRAQNTAAYTAVLAQHTTQRYFAGESKHYRRMQYGGDFGGVRFLGHFDPQTYAENREAIEFLLNDLPGIMLQKHANMVVARLVHEKSYDEIGIQQGMTSQVVRGTLSKKYRQLLGLLTEEASPKEEEFSS